MGMSAAEKLDELMAAIATWIENPEDATARRTVAFYAAEGRRFRPSATTWSMRLRRLVPPPPTAPTPDEAPVVGPGVACGPETPPTGPETGTPPRPSDAI